MDNTPLLLMIKERCYKEGSFPLSSGRISNYYVDLRMVELYSEALPLIGHSMCDHILNFNKILFNEKGPLIGGIGFGAVPLISSTLNKLQLLQIPVEGFFIREVIKSHGMSKAIEGNFHSHSDVILLEDVCTTGQSVLKAAQLVEIMDCNVILILSLLDRLEGASQTLSKYNYQSIFTIDDLRAA